MKNITFYGIAASFTASIALGYLPAVSAQEDTTPPTLHSVDITPHSVKDGNSVTISVHATDDIAGVASVVVFIEMPDGMGEREAPHLSFDEGSQRYIRTYQLPEFAQTGTWLIKQVLLEDKAGNRTFINKGANLNATFQVQASQSDTTPPTLHAVEITPTSVKDGDSVTISVHATDDIAGVANVAVFIEMPDGMGERNAPSLSFDEGSQRYIRTYQLPEFAQTGTWLIKQVLIEDKAGNRTFINKGANLNATFQVQASQSDTTPPTLHAVEITPNAVKDGETITISVHATDDIAGVASVVVFVEMPDGMGEREAPHLSFDEGSQRYIRTYQVPKFAQTGTWLIKQVLLEDKAENRTFINSGPNLNASFQVGISRLASTIQDEDTRTEILTSERAAILIHPRGQGSGYRQEASIQFMATHIYRTLQVRGYSSDDIYFLSYEPELDINGDGFVDNDVVDGPVTILDRAEGISSRDLTLDDIQQAFNWAKEKGTLDHPLIITFVDHALTGKLRLDPFDEVLTAQDLDTMLDDYQQTTGNSVIVVLEACHTGSLIEEIQGDNRVIISATDEDLAYYDNLGAYSFSKFYFDNLRRGEDFNTAFGLVTDRLSTYGHPFNQQAPQLEDDGDGIPNTSRDGKLADKWCLNGCFGALSGEMTLEAETQSMSISSGQSVSLSVRVGITEGSIQRVWALIIPPETTPQRNEQGFSLNPTPVVNLSQDANDNNRWLASFKDFPTIGNYVVTFMAEDNEGFITATTPITLSVQDSPIAPKENDTIEDDTILPTPIPNQSVYHPNDILRVTLPTLPAGQEQYMGIASPDGNIFVLNYVNQFTPFDGSIIPQWQGNNIAMELPIVPWMPRGQYVLYLLRMPIGIEPLKHSEQWQLGMMIFEVK